MRRATWGWLSVVVGCAGAAPAAQPQPRSAAATDSDNGEYSEVFAGSFKVETHSDPDSLRPYQRIEGDLVVEAPGLVRIELPTIAAVGSDLFVSGNSALSELSLPALVEVGGGIYLWDNAVLSTTEGLKRVQSIGGDLHVTNNAQLTRVTFGPVTTVKSLRIEGNPQLVRLDGLRSLREVGGDLIVDGNPLLAELPFDSLQRVTGKVWIQNNPRLPTCAAQALARRLNAASQTGEVAIRGNLDAGPC
jgi:hypothetical protein